MTRMIERWFPCTEVSEASAKGWGSGSTERNLFTWFAARPTAQAKAAVLTSLLPWPDDEAEQKRLQDLVREAMTGRYVAWDALRLEILKSNPNGGAVLDPFSGRGMIPLEAARLGLPAHGIDYSPVAVLASKLLIDYPFRDWSAEPEMPFGSQGTLTAEDRLIADVDNFLSEVGRRFKDSMGEFFPVVDGKTPWGYLWAVTLPCQECSRRFPLVGSYELRNSNPKKNDLGQSFYISTDEASNSFAVVVHDGTPSHTPTLAAGLRKDGKKARGKSAICPFCSHVHPLAVHQRLAGEGLGEDTLLIVADVDPAVGKCYRRPSGDELTAASSAAEALVRERPFTPMLDAIPQEEIPLNNGATIRPSLYGAVTYGDLCTDRQTLGLIRLSRIIADLAVELRTSTGISGEYAKALAGYAGAMLNRKIRYSTRAITLYVGYQKIGDVFLNEGAVGFSYDFFEVGIGDGPGSWESLKGSSMTTLRSLVSGRRGSSGTVQRGSATTLPFKDGTMAAVVTDPPYDSMVYYSDSSDLFYVWLKRALHTTRPEMAITSDPRGLQEKTDEVIVKEHGKSPGEHRTREHYDRNISRAFSEMRRVVADDGLVTIVFGHGEPEVWHRLLSAISSAELVLTGSWPAKTESGGQQGKANIVTTLTMACRPAPANRPIGRAATVESEVKAEVKARMALWSRAGLAPTDMLMASAGPAMEVVGRYANVMNNKGVTVEPDKYLLVARKAVQEGEAISIDHHPLETFDARTRFALWWVRLFRKQVAAKSELRWQSLASDMDVADVRDLVPDAERGCRFVAAKDFKRAVNASSSVIDVALVMAATYNEGLDAVGEVLVAWDHEGNDEFLWAAISFLAERLPDADPDVIAWTGLLRARKGVASAARGVTVARQRADAVRQYKGPTLFDALEQEVD